MLTNKTREVELLTSPGQLKTSGIYVVKSEIFFPQADAYRVDFNALIGHSKKTYDGTDYHYGIEIGENVTLIFEGGCFTTGRRTILDPKLPNENQSEEPLGMSGVSDDKFYFIGKYTVLKAGAEQIFGDGIEVTGTWITDRSYPQWFDCLAGTEKAVHAFRTDHQYFKHLHDCSDAINKAIRLKGVGEVFLPIGNYYISHPIKLPIGITLVGETYRNAIEGTQDEQLFKIWSNYGWFDEDCACVGSIIIPYIDSVTALDNIGEKYSTPFDRGIFRINLEDDKKDENGEYIDEWVTLFPLNVSAMKDLAIFNLLYTDDIKFYDDYTDDEGNTEHVTITLKNHIEIARKECCVVAGGYTFQNVKWYNFPMAIRWTDAYCDLRKITDCSIQMHPIIRGSVDFLKDEKHECMYMIKIPSLGDALQITHSSTDVGSPKLDQQQFFKALYVRSCHGGSISDCILNMDVVLSGCTGLTFRNNHMENGAQVLISESIVELTGNHFEKGRRPSLLFEVPQSRNTKAPSSAVDETNVIIRGNYFMSYTLQPEASEATAQRTPIKKISPYDIAFDKKFGGVFNVRLTANYRYSHNVHNSLQPTGIMLGLVDNSSAVPQITPFEDFNKYSYFLSDECQIHEGFRLDFCRVFNEIPQISGGSFMNNGGVPFVNDSAFTQNQTVNDTHSSVMGINPGTGTSDEMTPDPNKELYQYQAQPFLDVQRGIAGERQELHVNGSDSVDNQHGTGILIGLAVTSGSTPCMMRLFKTVTNGKGENALFYVDIPMVGGRYLYDNGYSVNCYPWIKITGANIINPNIILNVLMIKSSNQTGIKRVSFMGDNVKAFGDSSTLPKPAGWKATDEFVNVSAGNAGHYCLGVVNGQKEWIKI